MANGKTAEDKTFVRGLEGVVAAETNISWVDGIHGKLYYWGYDIHDIAEKVTFEEVIFLLWNGRFPNRAEWETLRRELASEMRLPSQVVDLLKLMPPNAHPMQVLQTAVAMLGVFDPDSGNNGPEANLRKAKRLVAQVPTLIADLHRIRKGLPLISADPQLGIADNFLYMLRGAAPAEIEHTVIDLIMVLHTDHGLNASTFAGRVIASTLADMHAALAGAIGALKGPLHGGANQKVMEMILQIGRVDMVQDYIAGMLENKRKIMGFGHRVYRTEDPRARHLRKYSEMLCEMRGFKELYDISHKVETLVRESKGIYPNVDFYSATVQHAMGIPADFFTAVFAASRTAGWVAHIMEQYADNRLIRPTSKYTAELGIPFVPMDRRS
jgi:citrate synthase